jgi:hypothetical protein
MSQTRPKLNLDRRDGDPTTRFVVVTAAPYSPNPGNKTRDWTPMAAWAVAEASIIKSYRQQLLDTSIAGPLRQFLSETLKSITIPDHQMRVSVSGQDSASEYPWVDGLTPCITGDNSVDPLDVDEVGRLKDAKLKEERDVVEIQRLLTVCANSSVAQNPLGPKGSIDAEVCLALEKLRTVSELIHYMGQLFSLQLQATSLNAARNRYRAAYNGEEETPPFDPNTPLPSFDFSIPQSYKDEFTSKVNI